MPRCVAQLRPRQMSARPPRLPLRRHPLLTQAASLWGQLCAPCLYVLWLRCGCMLRLQRSLAACFPAGLLWVCCCSLAHSPSPFPPLPFVPPRPANLLQPDMHCIKKKSHPCRYQTTVVYTRVTHAVHTACTAATAQAITNASNHITARRCQACGRRVARQQGKCSRFEKQMKSGMGDGVL